MNNLRQSLLFAPMCSGPAPHSGQRKGDRMRSRLRTRHPSAAFAVLSGILLVLGCGSGTSRGASEMEPPWTIQEARTDLSDGLQILLMYDMEGLSGQDDPETTFFRSEQYALGQDLLVGDVNAVVRGLSDGGVERIDVVDAHGSGNRAPDLPPGRLDSNATYLFRRESFDPYADLPEEGRYDAVVVVGMHARPGSRGFLAHFYNVGVDLALNGTSITETELVALFWGEVGVPVVFASGDDRLREELSGMPWLQYVTVKTATSASSADLIEVNEVHARLREAATRAVQDLSQARIMTVRKPIAVRVRAQPPATLQMMEGFPSVDYRDNAVAFQAADLWEAYHGFEEVAEVADLGSYDVLFEQIRERADRRDIIDEWTRRLVARWLDYESGRWVPSERVPDAHATDSERYFGFH